MRFWICLILAACGAEPQPPPAPARALPQLAPPTAHDAQPSAPPLTAAHGAEIVALGVTTTGDAAVTADRLGGIRLWPTLDGTREPVVIRGTAARMLAVAHDTTGFTIGMVDAAGGLVVIRTGLDGAVQHRAPVAGDQAVVELIATRTGMLALRADQILESIDAAGAIRARLVPEPGTRIDSLISRGDHVLAMIQEDKHVRGRWLAIGGDAALHWGAAIPAFPFPLAQAALSPSGELLAASRTHSLHPVLIDLATGSVHKQPLCVDRRWPAGELSDDEDQRGERLFRRDNAPTPLGFLDETHVACAVMGQLRWWSTDGTAVPIYASPMRVVSSPAGPMPMAATDRALVIGVAESLAFTSPTRNQFLGYSLHDLASLRTGPGGVMIGGQQQLVIGPDLRERSRFEIGLGNRIDWADAVPLDDRFALTVTTRRGPGSSPLNQLAVFDGLAGAERQVLPYDARASEIAYEPSTRLLATTDGTAALVVRYDPASHTFGVPIQLPALPAGTLAVVDPARANGVAVLHIAQSPTGATIGEFFDADLAAGRSAAPRASYHLDREIRAIDRAGHIYTHAADDGDDVIVYIHGLRGPRLKGVAAATLRPSPDGQLIAVLHSPTLSLVTVGGEVRWEVAHWDAGEVAWTPSGELFARFSSGIARIDTATGELAARHCGWGFGLTDQLLGFARSGPTVCDAMQR